MQSVALLLRTPYHGRMHSNGPEHFLQGLSADQQQRLFAQDTLGRQGAPTDSLHWHCGGQALGLLAPERAAWLLQHLRACSLAGHGVLWDAAAWSTAERSDCLQAALLEARAQGLMPGWRNEKFSFWHADCAMPDPQQPALFQAERAGFRFLGLLSHAVHVNGFLPDGRLWCGRRSLTKATDPGMLDNVTAGGLPSGETMHGCLQRELAEEAGLFSLQGHALQAAGSVRTSRMEAEGWHDEFVHVFNLTLSQRFVPANQDGEVADFLCLQPAEVLARMEAGEFTLDAAQTLLQGLRLVQGAV
jgi:8-oxo-dGTP pyrophosphatase MutT (NUDIX family)